MEYPLQTEYFLLLQYNVTLRNVKKLTTETQGGFRVRLLMPSITVTFRGVRVYIWL